MSHLPWKRERGRGPDLEDIRTRLRAGLSRSSRIGRTRGGARGDAFFHLNSQVVFDKVALTVTTPLKLTLPSANTLFVRKFRVILDRISPSIRTSYQEAPTRLACTNE